MTVEQLTTILGVVVSLLAAYLPKFSTWYGNLTGQGKALFMLGLSVLWGVGVVGGACLGLNTGYTCGWESVFPILQLIIAFAISNQATYFMAVRPYKQ